jgi:hypothetical protein
MKLGAIIRLAAIALGILSATIMAQRGFEIRFNEYFLGFLDRVGDLVGIPLTPVEVFLVRPALRLLHALGLKIELHDHWKYAFILVWLLLRSLARVVASWQFEFRVDTVFNFTWGGFCALLAGVLAGTVPFSDPGVFWWPFAFSFLFVAGLVSRYDTLTGHERKTQLGALGVFRLLLFVFIGILALLAARVNPLKSPFFEATRAPSLAYLATFIGFLGALALMIGAVRRDGEGDTWWQKWLGSTGGRMGLDVLAVLGGAAFITWAAHALA